MFVCHFKAKIVYAGIGVFWILSILSNLIISVYSIVVNIPMEYNLIVQVASGIGFLQMLFTALAIYGSTCIRDYVSEEEED